MTLSSQDTAPVRKNFRISDVRGIAQLAIKGTREVTSLTEHAHWQVLHSLRLASRETSPQTRGITGLVYRSIHGIAKGVGWGLEEGLKALEPRLGALDDQDAGISSEGRAVALAVLNGVIGDELAASGNPLAIPMSIKPLNSGTASTSGRVAILAHGLCMGVHQWQPNKASEVDCYSGLARWLAEEQGYTVYLVEYNSGRRIADNGHELAELIDRQWNSLGQGAEEVLLLGYSMGGLLLRSACEEARRRDFHWLQSITQLVTVGTPHHGSPLERLGQGFQEILGSIRHTAPYVRLGELRSAGITDLRHGAVTADITDANVPLPQGVTCYAIAATLAEGSKRWADHRVGDGLVPVYSALGRHRDPQWRLTFPEEHQAVLPATGHLQLLHSPEVANQLARWLSR